MLKNHKMSFNHNVLYWGKPTDFSLAWVGVAKNSIEIVASCRVAERFYAVFGIEFHGKSIVLN